MRASRSLVARLAPYLRDTPQPSRLVAFDPTLTPFPTVERWIGRLTAVDASSSSALS